MSGRKRNEKKGKAGRKGDPVSLHPLDFDEAVADLLKVKPASQEKRARREPKRKKT